MSVMAAPTWRTPAQSFEHFKALEAANTATLAHDGIHIMRLDGRAFSTYTRGLQVPFDAQFAGAMDAAAVAAARELGALVTFVASDEISVAFAARGERSELPFGGQVPKLLSLVAAAVTATFNLEHYARKGKLATFDARLVTVPHARDLLDYLTWRQADTYRNAVMMAAQALFSHHELLNVGVRQAREMVEQRNGAAFTDTYPAEFYAGRQVFRKLVSEPVTYTHARTGVQHTVVAERGHWGTMPAPAYRHMTAEDGVDALDPWRDAH